MPFVPRPKQSLKLIRPPFKPIFKYGGRRVAHATASRTTAFAAALQARYDGRSEGFRAQGLVYRWAALGLFVNRIYHQVKLTLAPRLQLSFQAGSQQRFSLPTHLPLHSMPLSIPASPRPALKPVAVSIWRRGTPLISESDVHLLEIQRVVQETSRLTAQIPTQMIQRLAARLERVETVHQHTSAPRQKNSQILSASTPHFSQLPSKALPIPQVTLKRTQAIRLEDDQLSDPRSQNVNRRQFSAAQTPESTLFPPTDMNLYRLADQVVQVINDRVTARQERFGRI
jgi:hypothetical protein